MWRFVVHFCPDSRLQAVRRELTKGKLVPVSEVQNLLDHLATLPEPESTIHRIRLWAHPIWGGILIVLLGIFWIGRKMIGAV